MLMHNIDQVKVSAINFLNHYESWKAQYLMVKDLFDYEKEFDILDSNQNSKFQILILFKDINLISNDYTKSMILAPKIESKLEVLIKKNVIETRIGN